MNAIGRRALLSATLILVSGCLAAGPSSVPDDGSLVVVPPLRVGDRFEYHQYVAAAKTTLKQTVEIGAPVTRTAPCFQGERRILPLNVSEAIGTLGITRVYLLDAGTRLVLGVESTVAGRGPYWQCSLLNFRNYDRAFLTDMASIYWSAALAGSAHPLGVPQTLPIFDGNLTYRFVRPATARAGLDLEISVPTRSVPEAPPVPRNMTLHYRTDSPLAAGYETTGALAVNTTLASYKAGREAIAADATPAPPPVARRLNAKAVAYGADPELDGGPALLSFRGALATARASAAFAAYAATHADNKVLYAHYQPNADILGPAGTPQWCIHFASVKGTKTGNIQNEGFRSCVRGQDATSPPYMVVASEGAADPQSKVEIPEAYVQPRISLSGLVESVRNANPTGVDIRYFGGASRYLWGTPAEAMVVFSTGTGDAKKQSNYSAITGELWVEFPG